MEEKSYWFPYACVGGGPDMRMVKDARVRVAGNVFSSVEADVLPNENDVVFSGVAYPGFANAHSHAFHRALRGMGPSGSTFWQWREAMYRVANRLNPDIYYEFVKALYAEMLLAGYTAVAEFHYVHHLKDGRHYENPNATGLAIAQAARDVGMRCTLIDVCYLHGGIAGEPLASNQVAFSDGDAAAWRARYCALKEELAGSGNLVRVGAAIHSVRACSLSEMGVVRETVGAGPLHVHVSEQIKENEDCLAVHGVSPVELLARMGVLGQKTTLVHAVHVSDADVSLIAQSGSSICMCPTTEADLADGISPSEKFVSAGVPLCVGTDENVVVDPFEEMRQLDAHERLRTGRRDTHGPMGLLRDATANGYAACGWPEGGFIAPGALADFVICKNDSVRTAGATVEGLACSATAADVMDVFVGGEHVVRDGSHKDGSPAESLARLVLQLREEA